MASPVLQRFVTVHHEFLGRVHEPAVHALYAGRVGIRVELRDQKTPTLPEALVIDFEALFGEFQLDGAVQLLLGVRRVRAPVDERVTQALRVRLGDEPAGRRGERQDPHHLQDLQLVGGATRAVDVQIVAHRVDLLEREIPQHCVEDLRQAQALLAAHHEARDGLALQDRLAPLRGAVGRDEERPGHHRRRLHRGEMQHGLRGVFAILFEEQIVLPPGRSSERDHGAQVKLFESLLQSRVRLETLSRYCFHVSRTALSLKPSV